MVKKFKLISGSSGQLVQVLTIPRGMAPDEIPVKFQTSSRWCNRRQFQQTVSLSNLFECILSTRGETFQSRGDWDETRSTPFAFVFTDKHSSGPERKEHVQCLMIYVQYHLHYWYRLPGRLWMTYQVLYFSTLSNTPLKSSC